MERRKICVILAGTLALVLGLATFQINDSRGALLRLFDESYGKNADGLQRVSTDYILQCCAERDVAYAELEKNGFQITTRHWAPGEPYPTGFKVKEYYDETILGVRGPSLARIFDVFASYKITIFVRDGRVVKISARIDRAMP